MRPVGRSLLAVTTRTTTPTTIETPVADVGVEAEEEGRRDEETRGSVLDDSVEERGDGPLAQQRGANAAGGTRGQPPM